MVQLFKPKKPIVTNEDKEIVKEKMVAAFNSENVVCKNLKGYEAVYFDVCKNANLLKVLNDEDLMQTAILFFDNNLNISLTSKAGYMHRNTLIYRLDKIKTLIGLDIRNFNEACVLENLIYFHKEKTKK